MYMSIRANDIAYLNACSNIPVLNERLIAYARDSAPNKGLTAATVVAHLRESIFKDARDLGLGDRFQNDIDLQSLTQLATKARCIAAWESFSDTLRNSGLNSVARLESGYLIEQSDSFQRKSSDSVSPELWILQHLDRLKPEERFVVVQRIVTMGKVGVRMLNGLLKDPDKNREAIAMIREICKTFPGLFDLYAPCAASDDPMEEANWIAETEVSYTYRLLAGLHELKLSSGNGNSVAEMAKTYDFISESLGSLDAKKTPDWSPGIQLNQQFFKQNVVLRPSDVDGALLKLKTEGTPFLLAAGCKCHHIDILFFPNYVVVCNRGVGRPNQGEGKPDDRSRSFAFGCDTQNLQTTELKILVEKANEFSIEEFTKQVYWCLPKAIVMDKSTTEIVDMINALPIGDQTIGNCWIPQVPILVWWVNHLKTIRPDLSAQQVVAEAFKMFRLIKVEQIKRATAKLQELYDRRPPPIKGRSIAEFLNFINNRRNVPISL